MNYGIYMQKFSVTGIHTHTNSLPHASTWSVGLDAIPKGSVFMATKLKFMKINAETALSTTFSVGDATANCLIHCYGFRAQKQKYSFPLMHNRLA